MAIITSALSYKKTSGGTSRTGSTASSKVFVTASIVDLNVALSIDGDNDIQSVLDYKGAGGTQRYYMVGTAATVATAVNA